VTLKKLNFSHNISEVPKTTLSGLIFHSTSTHPQPPCRPLTWSLAAPLSLLSLFLADGLKITLSPASHSPPSSAVVDLSLGGLSQTISAPLDLDLGVRPLCLAPDFWLVFSVLPISSVGQRSKDLVVEFLGRSVKLTLNSHAQLAQPNRTPFHSSLSHRRRHRSPPDRRRSSCSVIGLSLRQAHV